MWYEDVSLANSLLSEQMWHDSDGVRILEGRTDELLASIALGIMAIVHKLDELDDSLCSMRTGAPH